MGVLCSVESHRETKHQAVSRGLHAIVRKVTIADRIDLWEFDDALHHVGSTTEPGVSQPRKAVESRSLLALVEALTPPRGGTEIGQALAGVMARSPARDLLLITDGKSFALDVQEFARYGRRVCVVLIGEDSLEANVGHLSALTGGEIFVAAGNDLTAVLTEALRSLRVPCSSPERVSGVVRSTSARRGGMTITASWSDSASATAPTIETRGVTAVAASLLLPALTTEDAAVLAERESLVTHLTSLVLVDEVGDTQQTVPATRKVPLPSPRTHVALVEHVADKIARVANRLGVRPGRSVQYSAACEMPLFYANARVITPSEESMSGVLALSSTTQLIDWNLAPQKLQSGDLSMLASAVEQAIRKAATNEEVAALARTLDLDPVVLLVGLLAHAARSHRTAARIARAIFGGEPPAEASAVLQLLGIERLPVCGPTETSGRD